jgi:hypothetical protein
VVGRIGDRDPSNKIPGDLRFFSDMGLGSTMCSEKEHQISTEETESILWFVEEHPNIEASPSETRLRLIDMPEFCEGSDWPRSEMTVKVIARMLKTKRNDDSTDALLTAVSLPARRIRSRRFE